MDTQKINLNNEEKKDKKEGFDGATVAMTAAGAAAAGVVGATLLNGQEAEAQTTTTTTATDSNGGVTPQTQPEEQPATDTQTQQPAQTAQTTQTDQSQQANVDELTPIATDQPGNTGGQAASTGSTTTTTETPAATTTTGGSTPSTTIGTETTLEAEAVDPAEAEALAIAEALVGEDEIDINDIDAPTVAILDSDVIYAEDGSEIPVALVSIPGESDPYILADVDGDRIYDYVLDANGEIVDTVSSGLNIDDAEIALSGDAGYLAVNEDSIEILNDEDITDDIFVLDDGEYEVHNEAIPNEDMAYTGDDESFDDSGDVELLDGSQEIDDIMTDISYDAPDEV